MSSTLSARLDLNETSLRAAVARATTLKENAENGTPTEDADGNPIPYTPSTTALAAANALSTSALIESKIVELIRTARVDAKIDSQRNAIVMATDYPTIYQQVIDRTKSLSYRSQQLTQSIEKKYAARAEVE